MGRNDVRTSFTVPEELYKKLKELADKNKRSLSMELNFAAEEYVKRHYSPSGEHPPLTPDQKLQEVQRTAREYVKENPEILMELYDEFKKEK
ncbi:MAG: ribbon-helix-helix protein, CopG family [Methanogenium sp.]|nr:ribbon-helix-helix protein, CopG family [Methanogenium sp.]